MFDIVRAVSGAVGLLFMQYANQSVLRRSLTTTAVDESAPEAAQAAGEALADVSKAVCSIVNTGNTTGT